MSKVLSTLLDKPEQFVKDTIKELEALSGFPSEDVRLIADNSAKIRQKISDMGLDPDDTTNEELYHALLARFARDTAQLDQAVGVEAGMSLDHKMDLAINLTKHLLQGEEVWALKPVAAKRLLQTQSPKRLMKAFNYRSVDSLLKREPIALIYLTASFIESSAWNKSLQKAAHDLNTTDWTRQPPDFMKLSMKHLQSLPAQGSFIVTSKLVGSAALLPKSELQKASVLNLSLLFEDALQELGLENLPRKVTNLHPVLNWWSDTAHLLAVHNDEPVSLNLRDLALSHLQAADYESRSMSRARESLWEELLQRYQNYISQDAEILSKFSVELAKDSFLPAKLAEQYAEA